MLFCLCYVSCNSFHAFTLAPIEMLQTSYISVIIYVYAFCFVLLILCKEFVNKPVEHAHSLSSIVIIFINQTSDRMQSTDF